MKNAPTFEMINHTRRKKRPQTEGESRYHKGWLPIADTRWKVETLDKDGNFVTLGTITVLGKTVGKEMDDHQSIKGYEPYDIAEHEASMKFPKANPIIVSRIWGKEDE